MTRLHTSSIQEQVTVAAPWPNLPEYRSRRGPCAPTIPNLGTSNADVKLFRTPGTPSTLVASRPQQSSRVGVVIGAVGREDLAQPAEVGPGCVGEPPPLRVKVIIIGRLARRPCAGEKWRLGVDPTDQATAGLRVSSWCPPTANSRPSLPQPEQAYGSLPDGSKPCA